MKELVCMWKLTDEWAYVMLAYETELYWTPYNDYVLEFWVVSDHNLLHVHIYM